MRVGRKGRIAKGCQASEECLPFLHGGHSQRNVSLGGCLRERRGDAPIQRVDFGLCLRSGQRQSLCGPSHVIGDQDGLAQRFEPDEGARVLFEARGFVLCRYRGGIHQLREEPDHRAGWNLDGFRLIVQVHIGDETRNGQVARVEYVAVNVDRWNRAAGVRRCQGRRKPHLRGNPSERRGRHQARQCGHSLSSLHPGPLSRGI